MTNPEYILWLLPAPDARPYFVSLIDRMSARFGTPRFEPHVTVASATRMDETAVVACTERLARVLLPVTIFLEGAAYSDMYFRCLYLRARRSPAVLAAHRAAREHLGQSPAPDFMPHLSLVYGEIEAAEKEKAIVEEIAGRFPTTFLADRLLVCKADGPPGAWTTIGPFLLTKPSC